MALVKWGVQVCEMCNCILDDNLKCPECERCKGDSMKDQNFDEVNNPAHYNLGDGLECIDYIKQVLGVDGFIAYCHGNMIKYQHRHKYKRNPVQDIETAQYYLNKMLKVMKPEKYK